jgi:hypothetical protein
MNDELLRAAANRPLTIDEETELIDALTQRNLEEHGSHDPPMDAEKFVHIIWHNEIVATWLLLFSPLDTESLAREITMESKRVFGDVNYSAADPGVWRDQRMFETPERLVYTKALEFLHI